MHQAKAALHRPPAHTFLCAGYNTYGHLGIALGNTSSVSIPVPVAATAGVTSGWAAVSAGGSHTCAIAESTRAAYCWGACGALVRHPSGVVMSMS